MRRNQKRENTSELTKLRHYDYKNYDILKKKQSKFEPEDKNYDILKKKQSKFEPEDRHCLDNWTSV
jgi:hypothetical protein